MSALMLRLGFLVPMITGCFTVYDHGSDVYSTGGISLVYTDWVVPQGSRWEKDTHECDQEAREATPTIMRLPGTRQALADRCMMTRGYVRRSP
jgi:hypothetical protein